MAARILAGMLSTGLLWEVCTFRDVDCLLAIPVDDWPGHCHVLATKHTNGDLCFEKRYPGELWQMAVKRVTGDPSCA